MRRLDARDTAALLDLVAELHALDETLPLPPHFLARLRWLIPCDEVGYGETNPVARRSILHVWHGGDGDEGVVVGDEGWCEGPAQRELFWRLRDTFPVCTYRVASGDWTSPVKVSDFATRQQFRQTPFYDAFLGGVDDVLAVGLGAPTHRYRTVNFFRSGGRGFDERDRLVLGLLLPHLVARAERVADGVRCHALTRREREILEWVRRGEQNDAIANRLGIATRTVAKHLEHAYRKLGVANRTAAVTALGK